MFELIVYFVAYGDYRFLPVFLPPLSIRRHISFDISLLVDGVNFLHGQVEYFRQILFDFGL